MEDGPKHPSIVQKIGQPYLFIRHFPNSKAWTPAAQSFSGADAYVNRVMERPLLLACQGSASPLVSPLLPVSVVAPLEKHKVAFIGNFVVRGSSFISGIAFAPIDRVKLLMQSQNVMIKSGRLSMPYKGIVDCFARTVRNEGIISLWRGNTAYIIQRLSPQALLPVKNYFWSSFNYKEDKDGYWELFFAAGLAGATHFLTYPLEFAHTRLANDIKAPSNAGQRQFNGLIDVYRRTLNSDGLAGLYRGFSISFIESAVNRFISTELFASLKPFVLQHRLQRFYLTPFIVGMGVSVCGGLAAYPMDTVYRRMMMTSGEVVKYKSTLDAFCQIIKNEGIESLYKGASAYILRIAALAAFSFAVYEIFIRPVPAKNNVSAGGGQLAYDLTIRWK